MLCVMNLNKDCLEILLCNGADPDLESRTGYTALDYASELLGIKDAWDTQQLAKLKNMQEKLRYS